MRNIIKIINQLITAYNNLSFCMQYAIVIVFSIVVCAIIAEIHIAIGFNKMFKDTKREIDIRNKYIELKYKDLLKVMSQNVRRLH